MQKADRRGGDEDQHHGAKETEARLSTEKLINLNNATYDTLERLEADQKTAKWTGGAGFSTFISDVRDLCTRLAAYAKYKLKDSARRQARCPTRVPRLRHSTPRQPGTLECKGSPPSPALPLHHTPRVEVCASKKRPPHPLHGITSPFPSPLPFLLPTHLHHPSLSHPMLLGGGARHERAD